MAITPTEAPQLEGQVLFYKNPEALDSRRHGHLGLRSSDRPFRFAAKQHFVPLQIPEFAPAALSYPIIFAGGSFSPLAVMGINPGENLFIASDGLFRTGAYIPAFIRRYPFVVAKDDARNQLMICIDRGSDLFVENGGDIRLFENGQPTQYTKNCIEFCGAFDTDRQRTELFVEELKALELLEPKQTTFTPRLADGTNGEPQLIAEYYAVSEDKLKALPESKLAELAKSGALGQIYAHLISLLGFERLIMETAERQAMQRAAN